MRNVREVHLKSGLILKRRATGEHKGRWVFENPSWMGEGPTWAGIVGFRTLEEALEVADELADACEAVFQAKLDASRARQEFYSLAARLTPISSAPSTNMPAMQEQS